MSEDIIGKGWNIKCYDKIKLTHVHTNYRLHSNAFGLKSGTYNIAVSCHKMRQQSDWFVALLPQQPDTSYHFHYSDNIILKNVQAKKNLHLYTEYESSISKGMQVSLCEQEDREVQYHPEDLWTLERVQPSQDNYWRVGQILRFKNKQSNAYLCSHRRKIRQNDDYEVYGEVLKIPKQTNKLSAQEKQRLKQIDDKSFWMISEIVPFVYTVPITEKKPPKKTQQAEQLLKLKESKEAIPFKKNIKKNNENEELLRIENIRLEQIENQRLKLLQYESKLPCWKKYLCCCLFQQDQYRKI